MEHHVKAAENSVNLSAASAPPISVQNAQLAGAQNCHRKPTASQEHSAEEQAAVRSRERMVSFSPIRAKESDGQRRTRVEGVVDRMIAIPPSHDDPNGSYTGRPIIEGERPVQDADDL